MIILAVVPKPANGAENERSCRVNVRCADRLDGGLIAFKGQDFAVALKDFQAAYAIVPDPLLLLNLGRAHFRLGQPDKALEYYLRFEGAVPTPDADTAQRLERYKAEAREAESRRKNRRPEEEVNKTQVSQNIGTGAQSLPSRESPRRAFYKTWWFWTGTGVAVAAIGLGVGLGVGLRRNPLPSFSVASWR